MRFCLVVSKIEGEARPFLFFSSLLMKFVFLGTVSWHVWGRGQICLAHAFDKSKALRL